MMWPGRNKKQPEYSGCSFTESGSLNNDASNVVVPCDFPPYSTGGVFPFKSPNNKINKTEM
jgi:hypothetical protein